MAYASTKPLECGALSWTLNGHAFGWSGSRLAVRRAAGSRRRAARHQALSRHPHRQSALAVRVGASGPADPPSHQTTLSGLPVRRPGSAEFGPTCFAIPAASTSRTGARICARCRTTSGTGTPSIRHTTPALPDIGSRGSGDSPRSPSRKQACALDHSACAPAA